MYWNNKTRTRKGEVFVTLLHTNPQENTLQQHLRRKLKLLISEVQQELLYVLISFKGQNCYDV